MTLPAEVREELHIDAGDVIHLRKVNGRYTLFAAESWADQSAGALAEYARGVPPLDPEDMDKAVEDAILDEWNRFVMEVEAEHDK